MANKNKSLAEKKSGNKNSEMNSAKKTITSVKAKDSSTNALSKGNGSIDKTSTSGQNKTGKQKKKIQALLMKKANKRVHK